MVGTRFIYLALVATVALGCGGGGSNPMDSGVDSAVDTSVPDATPDAEPDGMVDSGMPDADAAPMGPTSNVLFNTAGQGQMSGGGFQMSLSVGAPTPYGSTSSATDRLETGASAFQR